MWEGQGSEIIGDSRGNVQDIQSVAEIVQEETKVMRLHLAFFHIPHASKFNLMTGTTCVRYSRQVGAISKTAKNFLHIEWGERFPVAAPLSIYF